MKEFIDKLIERLGEKRNEKYINGVSKFPSREQKVFDIAETIVNQLAEEYNNGWIPCSERLPESDGQYLVTIKKSNEVTILDFDTYNNEWTNFECITVHNVIAWRLLPFGYKQKEK